MKFFFIILFLISLNISAQYSIKQPQYINPVNKRVMSEPAKIILTYVGSIALNAVGDALNDEGHKDWGHLCNAASVGVLITSPFYVDYDRSKWYNYLISYTSLRIGLFDFTYNAVRGLPLNTIGSTSFWDKGMQKLNPPNTYLGRSVFFIIGIYVPINQYK
jgi:hypothetical protein